MKDLEALFSRTGKPLIGSAMDLGKWDVALGLERTIYLRNPNPHAKAVLIEVGHKDGRVEIDIPKEISPLETAAVKIKIPPTKFESEAEERSFFTDVLDSLSGTISWERP